MAESPQHCEPLPPRSAFSAQVHYWPSPPVTFRYRKVRDHNAVTESMILVYHPLFASARLCINEPDAPHQVQIDKQVESTPKQPFIPPLQHIPSRMDTITIPENNQKSAFIAPPPPLYVSLWSATRDKRPLSTFGLFLRERPAPPA